MGAIADAVASYAHPLLKETDGSLEQMQKAFSLSQFCWNLALLPEASREESIDKMQQALKMDDAEFDSFRRTVIVPMILRHEEMFPGLHQRKSLEPKNILAEPESCATNSARAKNHMIADRYAPCPCNSGKKYKFCCGKK